MWLIFIFYSIQEEEETRTSVLKMMHYNKEWGKDKGDENKKMIRIRGWE